jgi:hypothetical protein
MATITAQDIVKKALQKIGVIADEETASASQLRDGFEALNYMLDSWAGRSLLTTAQIQESFTLTANKGTYTIGATGADVTSSKPIEIISAYVQDSNSVAYPVTVVPNDLYDSYYDQLITGEVTRPQALFYDPGVTQQTVQTGTIKLYPYPDNASTYTLFINSEKAFTEFATLTDTVTFPPVYIRAIIYNLACELAPDYGVAIHPEVIQIAAEAMRIIENINSRNKRVLATVNFSGKARSFNILSGMSE